MAKGGTIKPLKNGKYQWIGCYIDNDGKKKRPKKTFNTEKEAEAYRKAQYEAKLNLKSLRNKQAYTVQEYFDKWRMETWSTEEYYSFNTTGKWDSVFNKHILPYIKNERIDCIDMTRFQTHLNEMAEQGLSHKYLLNIVQALKSMLTYAEAEELISINNIDKIKVKGRKKEYQIFNVLKETDFNTIYDYMVDREYYYANFYMFLHETGIRSEEIVIKEEDVDFDNQLIHIRRFIKNKKDVVTGMISKEITTYGKSSSAYRQVPITIYAERSLRNQIEYKKEHNIKSDYIFTSKTGGTVDTAAMLRTWHSTIQQINEQNDYQIPKCGLHALRKLFCKNARDRANLEWLMIQRIMGHSDIAVTQKVYYSMSIENYSDIAFSLNQANCRLQKDERSKILKNKDYDADGILTADGQIIENTPANAWDLEELQRMWDEEY